MEIEKTMCGIDVGAEKLDVVHLRDGKKYGPSQFKNTSTDHKRLIFRITNGRKCQVRVVLEATGTFHLDLALALHHDELVEVMVVNPRASRHFAEAMMKRAKTDPVDASVLSNFAQRMEFQVWRPPSLEAFELQTLARRINQIKEDRQAETSRLFSREAVSAVGKSVIRDIKSHLNYLQARIKKLEIQAIKLIKKAPELSEKFDLLQSVCGISLKGGIQILAELAVLHGDLTPAQWVAFAGLDPRPKESGMYKGQRKISKRGNKYLRKALYFPAITAATHQPSVRRYYLHLTNAGKKKMVAVIAVMRKLLHAIWGMFEHKLPFDGNKFYARSVGEGPSPART